MKRKCIVSFVIKTSHIVKHNVFSVVGNLITVLQGLKFYIIGFLSLRSIRF